MKKILALVALTLLSSNALAAAFSSKISVKGVEDELKDNIEAYLAAVSTPLSPAGLDNYQQRLQDKAVEATRALGLFYHSTATVAIEQVSEEKLKVVVNVDAGEPVVVRDLAISLTGEAAQDSRFIRLRDNLDLKPGDVFHHGKYEAIKERYTTLAFARGYFDFTMSTNKVSISTQSNSADIELAMDSGVRYQIGEIRVIGDPRYQDVVLDSAPFESHQPYLANDLSRYSSDLTSTGYFTSVIARPVAADKHDGVVPIEVIVEGEPRDTFELGGGVSTDNGPHISAKWRRPWVNRHGHGINAETYISLPDTQFYLQYSIPLEDATHNYLGFNAGMQHLNNNDTESLKWTVSANRYWRLGMHEDDWKRNAYIRYEYEDWRQGSQEGNSQLIIPGVNYNRTRQRQGLDIFWGDKQEYMLEGGSQWLASDIDLVRATVRQKWIRSLDEERLHRFYGRFSLGAMYSNDYDQVPASLRYFAGGDQSVRGFDYEGISPVDDNGELLGGRYLVDASVEYAYRFIGNWSAAVFVDAGTATNDFSEPVKIGTGIGGRWQSPIGPIRLDVGFGVSEVHIPWRIHFSLGPDL